MGKDKQLYPHKSGWIAYKVFKSCKQNSPCLHTLEHHISYILYIVVIKFHKFLTFNYWSNNWNRQISSLYDKQLKLEVNIQELMQHHLIYYISMQYCALVSFAEILDIFYICWDLNPTNIQSMLDCMKVGSAHLRILSLKYSKKKSVISFKYVLILLRSTCYKTCQIKRFP